MDIYLVQHGEARPEVEDPERSLTDRGEETVCKVAAWAARAGLRVDQIRHSGKRRAEQTAAILADLLRPIQGMVAVTGLAPNDDVKPVAETLWTKPRDRLFVQSGGQVGGLDTDHFEGAHRHAMPVVPSRSGCLGRAADPPPRGPRPPLYGGRGSPSEPVRG
jgi:hypothetical protein